MMSAYKREVRLRPDERIDDLQRNGYGIIQKKNGFCFGMDAVLLSGFAAVKRGETAVDLGTGTGIIPLLLSAKTEGQHFYGLEVQPPVAEMAARSVLLNGLEGRIDILQGNLRDILQPGRECFFPRAAAEGPAKPVGLENGQAADRSFGAGATFDGTGVCRDSGSAAAEAEQKVPAACRSFSLTAGTFDVVTSNPPYMKAAHGLQNPETLKAVSRHEVLCTLEEVCAAAAKLLKSGGRFYLVHRPQRLIEITEALTAHRLEPKRMKFVHPFADREANMVLIEAVRDAGHECRIEKPVIVYRSPGVYTDEIYEIYGY